MSTIDIVLTETGNGGDFQLEGNDLVKVYGLENQPYLGLCGGNVEQVTKNKVTEAQSFDWWGNNLLMPSNQAIQMNSTFEKIINTTPLTSAGRVIIENAIKKDLEFLAGMAKIDVSVTIVATDRIDVVLTIKMDASKEKIKVIQFKKEADGDWFISDFNNDFFL